MVSKEQKITQSRLKSSYLSSVISMSLVLFMFGIAGIFLINAQRVTNYLKNNISITIYLNDGLKESEVSKFQKSLDASSFVRETKHTSKEEAAKEFAEEMGKDFLAILDGNPLPESIEVWISANYSSPDSISAIQERLETQAQVQSIHYEKNFLELVNANIKKINLVLAILILLLFFVSIVLINNTIRLSVYAKRFSINTMKLVGATHGFISKPFLIQSIIRGAISGLIAIVMLYGIIYALQSELRGLLEFAEIEVMLFLFIGILFLGIAINFISTYFAVRKYIKIDVNKLYY